MKVGDKYIVEIDKIFEQDGEKLYRAKGMKTLVFDNKGLRKLKPLEEKNMEIIRDKAFEAGQVKGQNDAWELASKIVSDIYHGGYNSDEVTEIFGYFSYQNIWEDNTYAEAAAKVAEWERKKEEICVGDVVIDWNGDTAVIIQSINDAIKLLYLNGKTHNALKGKVTKTGRHIDVNAWLAQIGGEHND